MNRRQQIELSPEEQDAYLAQARTIILGSWDPAGYPHLVPMWFARIDARVHMTTFRKSQKVRNLVRNPKATLLVESGLEYSDLKGMMIRARAEVVDDAEVCFDTLKAVQERYGTNVHPDMIEALRHQASKRVVLRFHPERISSWDHRKLGGQY